MKWRSSRVKILRESKSEMLMNDFQVEASSPHAAYNSSAKVYVKVMDLNDNVPYFTEKIDEITISEGMITNEVLARYVVSYSSIWVQRH